MQQTRNTLVYWFNTTLLTLNLNTWRVWDDRNKEFSCYVISKVLYSTVLCAIQNSFSEFVHPSCVLFSLRIESARPFPALITWPQCCAVVQVVHCCLECTTPSLGVNSSTKVANWAKWGFLAFWGTPKKALPNFETFWNKNFCNRSPKTKNWKSFHVVSIILNPFSNFWSIFENLTHQKTALPVLKN